MKIQQSKRQKINPPNAQEEDDEKQQEIEEDDNNQENERESEQLVPVDNSEFAIIIDTKEDEAKDHLSDLEDIFDLRENVNYKADQNENMDDLKGFLEGFDDEELDGFL